MNAARTEPDVAATPEEVASYRSEQAKEYGQYVAVAPISFNGVPAYNPGDPVPASNVAKYHYDTDGLVAKAGSADARKTITAIHEGLAAGPVVVEPVSLGVAVPGQK